jgi:hypothetical protein
LGAIASFYSVEGGGFPFQTDQKTFDTVGLGRSGGVPTEVLTSRDALVDVFRQPGLFLHRPPHRLRPDLWHDGDAASPAATRDRAMWQRLTTAGIGSAIVLLLTCRSATRRWRPVGNRIPHLRVPVLVLPLQTAVPGLPTMALSALFVAPILSNPFYAATHPGEQQDWVVPLVAHRADDGQRLAGERCRAPQPPVGRRRCLRTHRRQRLTAKVMRSG